MNRHRFTLLVDVFCAKDVPFGVRIFNFHIFAYFSPKIVKIKPEIVNSD